MVVTGADAKSGLLGQDHGLSSCVATDVEADELMLIVHGMAEPCTLVTSGLWIAYI